MNVSWFPGHIKKARDEILNNLKNIDIIIEILDARAPLSTKSDFISKLCKNKKHLLILNKSDLSNPVKNDFYLKYFKNFDNEVILLNSKNNNISKLIDNEIKKICFDLIEKRNKKGLKEFIFKTMIVGMPNVGKSTFINSYVKKNITKTENRPGITKKNQWVKISKNLLLLDTPGITEPKIIKNNFLYNLILIGSLNEKYFNLDDVILYFINFMKNNYIYNLEKRYNIKIYDIDNDIDIINKIAQSKNFIKQKNDIDYNRTFNTIINDFRTNKLGKITLDET